MGGGKVMKKYSGVCLLMVISFSVISGGNNDFVKFPEGYKDSFTKYHTQNRANNKQVADMYANKTAIDSIKEGTLADGSIIIMEVYKPALDQEDKPVTGPDGLFKKSKLAAVAVMEKRSQWDADFPANERTGNWGFAIYTPDGNPKENDLDCVTCHTPLSNQNYMFTNVNLMKLVQ